MAYWDRKYLVAGVRCGLAGLGLEPGQQLQEGRFPMGSSLPPFSHCLSTLLKTNWISFLLF